MQTPIFNISSALFRSSILVENICRLFPNAAVTGLVDNEGWEVVPENILSTARAAG